MLRARIEALALPDQVALEEEEGKIGDPRIGRTAFDTHCRNCHAPVDLAAHLFGPDWPGDSRLSAASSKPMV